MGYTFVRGPFMLYETTAMLYKFVNKITFQSILSRQRLMQGAPATKALVRRMNRLQEILDEVCADLNAEDPVLRQYFGRIVSDGEETCLAYLLTEAFGAPDGSGFQESFDRIRAMWTEYRARGFWITNDSANTLTFCDEPRTFKDLFAEIQALNLSADLRLQIYGALRDFDASMTELANLMEPLAQHLEALYARESWILEETQEYWQAIFDNQSPIDFLLSHIDARTLENAGEDTRVAIMLMNCSHIHYWLRQDGCIPHEYSFIYIGSSISVTSITRKQNDDMESIGAILRAIGDKKRLETLRLLSKERMYLHELAEHMGIDPGSMSRILAALHGCGFLRQERVALRNYYQTDREIIHSFLELVETVIFQ